MPLSHNRTLSEEVEGREGEEGEKDIKEKRQERREGGKTDAQNTIIS